MFTGTRFANFGPSGLVNDVLIVRHNAIAHDHPAED
jgi:hypothetical protein